MHAIVKPHRGPGLELREVPTPKILPHDVLIKIKKTSICGTDLHIDAWDNWAQTTINPPEIIGHEYVGEVVEVGAEVTHVTVGEHVCGEGHIACGHCKNCLTGLAHCCLKTRGVGVQRPGAFAEFLRLPAQNIWKAPEGIPDSVLACFDPLGNAVHTAFAFNVGAQNILITGAGPIGCMAAAVARKLGAYNIVVTDTNPSNYRRELAVKMGATLAINTAEYPIESAMEKLGITGGFDVGFEMSGSPAALNTLIDFMVPGGEIALLGILPDNAAAHFSKVIFKALTIKGIYGRKIFSTWYQTSALVQSGLDITPVITHHFPYTEFRSAFDLLHKGLCGKIILEWNS